MSSQESLVLDGIKLVFERDNVPCAMPDLASWQTNEQCGLTCLYLMINIALPGQQVTFDDIADAAGEAPPGGFTIDELKVLAARFGLETEVIEGPIEELASLPAPAIVHLGELDSPGHYVCYVSTGKGQLSFIDGTSGMEFAITGDEHSRRSLNTIARRASGFLLVPVRSGAMANLVKAGAFSTWGAAGLAWLLVGGIWLMNAARARRSL